MLHKEPSLQGKVLPNIYLTITGGGTGIIPLLLEQGGASSYFVGAEIPYSEHQSRIIIDNQLGFLNENPKIVSPRTAVLLSNHSKDKILDDYVNNKNNYLAVGVTASLMKSEGERPERTNEAYACFNLNEKLTECHWTFEKGTYDMPVTFPGEYNGPMAGVAKPITRKYQERQLVANIWEQLIKVIYDTNSI